MFDYTIFTLEEYVSFKNKTNKDNIIYDVEDFTEYNSCELCDRPKVDYVFYGENFGQELYCEECLKKIANFMKNKDFIMNLIDAQVTKILNIKKSEYGFWLVKVEYIDEGGMNTTFLTFDKEEKARSIKVGYRFQH